MSGSLAGLRVIECTRSIAPSFCGKLLADLGAEVVKVEPPGEGDPCRHLAPFLEDIPGLDRSGLFLYLNTSKLGLTLNLAKPTGANLLRRLAADTDMLIEDFTPGQMAGWGLDFASLQQVNPRLIMLSLTPFGQNGPYSQFKTDHMVATHFGGVAVYTPPQLDDLNLPPLKPGGRQVDFLTGVTASIVTMGAIHLRERTGRGSHVDLSQHEAVLTSVPRENARYSFDGNLPVRGQPAVMGLMGLLRCKDGFVQLHSREERQWPMMLDLMGNPEWGKDPRFADLSARDKNGDALSANIQEWANLHTKEDISRGAQDRHIASAPVNNMDEVLSADQLLARKFFVETEHPTAGKLTMPGAPYHFDCERWAIRHPAPQLGEHNREILCGRLHCPAEDLPRLRAAGII